MERELQRDPDVLRAELEELMGEERSLSRRRAALHDRITFVRGGGFASLADADAQLAELDRQEREVSARRRELHAQIDDLRARLGLPSFRADRSRDELP